MMRANRHVIRGTVLLLGALAGCHWGANAKSYEPAMSPVGASVTLRVRGETTDRAGELYAVDSAGVVLKGARLVRVRWNRMGAMDVLKLGGGYDIRADQQVVDAAQRARLGAVSRFPQGLSGELLTRVLARLDQPALDEVQ